VCLFVGTAPGIFGLVSSGLEADMNLKSTIPGRRADFEALPLKIRLKAWPEARFPTRRHYCVTEGMFAE
jgi:hypothetical protein